MNWRQRAVLGAGVSAGVYIGVSALMARGLTRSRRLRVLDTPAAVGLDFDEVAFRSRVDRVQLRGWLIPPQGPAAADQPPEQAVWVAFVHGHGSNRADPAVGALGLARDLSDRGFGILMFDLRACGSSEGERSSAGYYERRDLLGALDFLKRRGVERRQIGVLGFSLGGAVALMTCARPRRVSAVVSDSAFADLPLIIRQGATGARGVFRTFGLGMRVMSRLLYGIDLQSISPVKAIAGSALPVMLIHGEQDEMVPMQHARLLARAIDPDHSEVWMTPDAGHVQTYRTHPEEYVERVTGFLKRATGR